MTKLTERAYAQEDGFNGLLAAAIAAVEVHMTQIY